jgi:hypothetical protein
MRRYLAAITVIVLIGAVVLALAGCGGADVAGDYTVEGDNAALKDVKLVLGDDGTFKISGPDSEGGATLTIDGTYTVDGDAITLKAKDVDEAEKGTIQDGKLVFKELTWVKQ